MNFLQLFHKTDINQAVQECRDTENAILLDVRTAEEYREGHVPGSINIPLDALDGIDKQITERQTPIFVYCHSGGRSAHAKHYLNQMGYQNVTNIGGIMSYRGEVERG